MRQLGNRNVLVIFSFFFLIINESSGLRCWRCSSDSTNAKFCGATIDINQMTEQQRKWNYVECGGKPETVANIDNLIPKCKVMLQLVHNVETYSRSCYWEPDNVPSNSCVDQKLNPSFVKTVACKTCVEDGCNDKLKQINAPEVKDNANENANKNDIPADSMTAAADSKSTAVVSVVSRTVLFVMLMLCAVIGY